MVWALIGCAADRPSPGDNNTTSIPEFVEVPAGTFLMGCTPSQGECSDHVTEHSVTLTHDYLVGSTEVTQAQFLTTMGYNPAEFADCGEACPVESVNWSEAAAYGNALSAEAGLTECYRCRAEGPDIECEEDVGPYACDGFRLLTEAEWEGAARCGADLLYAGSNEISEVGWTADDYLSSPQIVAGREPNACGIYDMSGNVYEWTEDWWDQSDPAYGPEAETDPVGPQGYHKILRGGSWSVPSTFARVSSRSADGPAAEYRLGFRVGRLSP